MGNDDDVNAGEGVFAVGNPFGLERSVSQGIVSNRSRNIEGQLYLQTDTAINPGNSGGPLFNQRGEVIGVTSLGARASVADNLAFAIPVAYVKEFINHREAFAFDKANPNTGYRYVNPPRRLNPNQPEGLKDRGERPEDTLQARRSTSPPKRLNRATVGTGIVHREFDRYAGSRVGMDIERLVGHRRRRARLVAWSRGVHPGKSAGGLVVSLGR